MVKEKEMERELPKSREEWLESTMERNRRLYGGFKMMAEEAGAKPEGETASEKPKKEDDSFELPDGFWEREEVIERINGIVASRVKRVTDEKVKEEASKLTQAEQKRIKDLEDRLESKEVEAQVLKLSNGDPSLEELLRDSGLKGDALKGFAKKLGDQLKEAGKSKTNRVNQSAIVRPDGTSGKSTSAIFAEKIAKKGAK